MSFKDVFDFFISSGHFVLRNKPVRTILVEGLMSKMYKFNLNLSQQFSRRCRLKPFYFSFGSHFVRWSREHSCESIVNLDQYVVQRKKFMHDGLWMKHDARRTKIDHNS